MANGNDVTATARMSTTAILEKATTAESEGIMMTAGSSHPCGRSELELQLGPGGRTNAGNQPEVGCRRWSSRL